MNPLRFRQIHLDFHTSPLITPIAEEFDPAYFAKTLVDAGVDSITCFSRCHHGMIYHDTQFEARHPGLSRNLLAEQIEACHKHNINVPIYITVGLDEFQATRHPEWQERDVDGVLGCRTALQACWQKLCLNSPYVDYVAAQTREVLENFDGDGIFFDIISQGECLCQYCLAGMQDAGLDPALPEHRRQYSGQVLSQLRARLTETVRAVKKESPLFYNSGHVGPHFRDEMDNFTHLELESLPSGGWGYDHFPLTVRYARNLDVDVLGMTGKFHKSWADFGGFKNPAAMEYECFSALAEGARCSVGDQLHPRGKLDAATYDLIGPVYRSMTAKEPWCVGAKAVTEIALFTPEAIGKQDSQVDSSALGALRMLLEGHHQFDVVDAVNDWSQYKVLILPDKISLDEGLQQKVQDYLQAGGALIASGRSCTDRQTESQFVLDAIPATLLGEAPFSPDYIVPCDALAAGIPKSPQIMYERAVAVVPAADAEILADVCQPYFNRTWEHFCSHAQTPPDRKADYPAVVRHGNVIHFAHPIFSMYAKHGFRTCRQLVLNALNLLLPEPLVTTEGPSTARITLLRQEAEKRHVLHVLHYIPERRCATVPQVEECIPLFNIRVGVQTATPKSVYLAPTRESIPYEIADGRIWITIPEVSGHAMVVLEEKPR